MKNKIKRFAKGDFHIPQPEIIFPETHIVMRVGEGEKYRGSFSLKNQGEGTIRGLVYPSSYRVQCDEQGFDGNPVNIYYTYQCQMMPHVMTVDPGLFLVLTLPC